MEKGRVYVEYIYSTTKDTLTASFGCFYLDERYRCTQNCTELSKAEVTGTGKLSKYY